MLKTKLHIIFCLFIACVLIRPMVFSQQQSPAKFLGGENELDAFISMEMVYPEKALKNDVEGTVTMNFHVLKNGKVGNAEIPKPVSEEIDAEALRILHKTLWEPAREMGNPVISTQQLSIKFSIRKYKKLCRKRGYKTPPLPATKIDSSNKVYAVRNVHRAPKPEFKKAQSLSSFISENLKYPDAAFRKGISGTVGLTFIVEPHGSASHIVVSDPLGGGCSQEAVRILKKIPWKPGMKNDQAVRTRMTLEFDFRLPQNQDMQYVPSNPNSAF